MFWDPGSSRGTTSRPEKKFLLGSKQKIVLHFAEAEILKPNNSPDLDRLILIDSGVAIDNDFDLLRVSGE
jgi:hypothetical protein